MKWSVSKCQVIGDKRRIGMEINNERLPDVEEGLLLGVSLSN